LVAAVAWFLPDPVELVVTPADPQWTASHHRWIAVLAVALVTFLCAGYDRAGGPFRPADRRYRRQGPSFSR
jgi:hypothetical protein